MHSSTIVVNSFITQTLYLSCNALSPLVKITITILVLFQVAKILMAFYVSTHKCTWKFLFKSPNPIPFDHRTSTIDLEKGKENSITSSLQGLNCSYEVSIEHRAILRRIYANEVWYDWPTFGIGGRHSHRDWEPLLLNKWMSVGEHVTGDPSIAPPLSFTLSLCPLPP